MPVIRKAWVEKSSGGKKDGSTGSTITGKESWKKRFVVVEDTPAPVLSWYKSDKVWLHASAACAHRAHSAHPLTSWLRCGVAPAS